VTTIVEAPTRVQKGPRWDRPVRLTALYHEHVAAGAELVERDGWLLPRSYGNPVAEQAAVREAVGLLDISESGKADLKSDDLDAALGAAFTGIGRVEIGRAVPAGEGGTTRVYRLTDGQALLVTAPGALRNTLDALGKVASAQICTPAEGGRRSFLRVTDLTSALCGVRLVGPSAPAVLERLSSLDLAPDRFADGALAQGSVARIHALIVRRDAAGGRMQYAGRAYAIRPYGYDLYVDRDLGAYLWEILLEQGAPLGLKPVGRDQAISDQPSAVSQSPHSADG
jgi:glycine cleavage system aminomethyltransferase T